MLLLSNYLNCINLRVLCTRRIILILFLTQHGLLFFFEVFIGILFTHLINTRNLPLVINNWLLCPFSIHRFLILWSTWFLGLYIYKIVVHESIGCKAGLLFLLAVLHKLFCARSFYFIRTTHLIIQWSNILRNDT